MEIVSQVSWPSLSRRELVSRFLVFLVDHTSLQRLHAMSGEWPDTIFRVAGLHTLRTASEHPRAARRAAGS
ncbi:MAG: hypothetical protein RLP09_36635 [Sandaracinaceae bacterium]